MSTEIVRVTMIKIPGGEAGQALALEGFKTFTKNQKKVIYQSSKPEESQAY